MHKRTEIMNPALFSKQYSVRRLTGDDVPAIAELCRKNTLYYEYCPPYVTEEGVRKDMAALPVGKDASDKYYAGYFDGARLVAVVDLIASYPNEETVFIGFFMTDVSVQNSGTGTELIRELCAYLKEAGYSCVCLAWVKGNPQAEHFWRKNGFAETGMTTDTEGRAVITARKDLRTQ